MHQRPGGTAATRARNPFGRASSTRRSLPGGCTSRTWRLSCAATISLAISPQVGVGATLSAPAARRAARRGGGGPRRDRPPCPRRPSRRGPRRSGARRGRAASCRRPEPARRRRARGRRARAALELEGPQQPVGDARGAMEAPVEAVLGAGRVLGVDVHEAPPAAVDGLPALDAHRHAVGPEPPRDELRVGVGGEHALRRGVERPLDLDERGAGRGGDDGGAGHDGSSGVVVVVVVVAVAVAAPPSRASRRSWLSCHRTR